MNPHLTSPEIRFSIYRQLLFPEGTVFMYPDDGPPDDSDDDEEWTDEDSEDQDSEDEIIEEMFRGGREYITADEVHPYTKEDYENGKRHPEILRANKQIYSEASSLLYTEAILVVEPGDIFALRNKPRDLSFGARHDHVWRYNPLKAIGRLDGNKVVYEKKANPHGAMEPHVFARFQKILFDANFDMEHTQAIELWIDDETHTIRKDDISVYQNILRSSPVMKDFVRLLSKSRKITHLEVLLEVEVMANSNLMMEELPDDDEEADEVKDKVDRLMDIPSEKAIEIFLDSKICDPLLKLSNVQTVHFKFGFEEREEDKDAIPYKPPQKYLDLFQSMNSLLVFIAIVNIIIIVRIIILIISFLFFFIIAS
ncbi:uncharacterized protein PAC_20113 [Phialocephala subalpina]|uniref:Uncharacterized protein n=1 Tax=Phialocephala subalpina TaxID=576137 RepID=A0A1L7XYR6_9HELO|nr:uncharacterized protein PAC_20113 [Phialocephala subalpina]